MVEIYFSNVIKAPISKIFFKKVAEIFYQTAKLRGEIVVSVTLIGNKEMQKLNKIYRGIDSPTDVLSFAEKDAKIIIPQAPTGLGEIIISYHRVKIQARQRKHSLALELCTLFVHGLAHLLGYDHNNNRDAEEMEALEYAVLKQIQKKIDIS